MATPADIAQRCKTFFRQWVIGDEQANTTFVGVRRRPLVTGVVLKDQELPSQEPNEELAGMQVTTADGKPGRVAEIMPLENVKVTLSGSTIALEFLYCIDYPAERVPALGFPPGTRAVIAEQDPRIWTWTVQALEAMRGMLGDDANEVRFDVEVTTAKFEEFGLEDILPGG